MVNQTQSRDEPLARFDELGSGEKDNTQILAIADNKMRTIHRGGAQDWRSLTPAFCLRETERHLALLLAIGLFLADLALPDRRRR